MKLKQIITFLKMRIGDDIETPFDLEKLLCRDRMGPNISKLNIVYVPVRLEDTTMKIRAFEAYFPTDDGLAVMLCWPPTKQYNFYAIGTSEPQLADRNRILETVTLPLEKLMFAQKNLDRLLASDEERKRNRPLDKKEFSIDVMSPWYVGYEMRRSWNGWACPLFTQDVARAILTDLGPEQPIGTQPVAGSYDDETFFWQYQPEVDRFYSRLGKPLPSDLFALTEEEAEEIDFYEGENVGTVDGALRLYGVGTMSWVWINKDNFKEEETDGETTDDTGTVSGDPAGGGSGA